MSKNLTGRLLIASPYLADGNFLRSVVFIIRHDVEGAFGLAINRPTDRRFRELVDSSDTDGAARDDDHIYSGGPVDGPLLALHDLAGVGEPCGTFEQYESDTLAPGETTGNGAKYTLYDHPAEPWGSMSIELGSPPAWITGDDDHLRILFKRPDAKVRFVSDYSGWGPGQLDEELRVGGWLVGDADSDLVFGDPNEVWEKAVQQCGHEILTELAPGVRFGNPNLN